MKKTALLLAFTIVFTALSGCSLEIPGINEAANVIQAFVYYNRTGNLPPNIEQILEDARGVPAAQTEDNNIELPENTGQTLENTLKATTKSEILKLAQQYYELAYPQIEGDTKAEYNRLISWKPDFTGKEASSEMLGLQSHHSVNVAMALSYTNAKNFYLAMAAAVFSINPENAVAAGNFAAAAAAYGDDLTVEGKNRTEVQQYYQDAEQIFHYALLLGGTGEKQNTLPLLVSLGNLYLDSKKYNEAYACFQSAREIDDEYSAAVEGLYKTYMALKQYQKALDLLADTTHFAAFAGAAKKASEKREEDNKKPQVQTPTLEEEVLEIKMDSFNTIDAVSAADFLDEIDAEAKEKLNRIIREVQGKMKYTAPEITMLSQYSSLKAISQPLGQSALEAFSEGVAQLSEDAYKMNEKVSAREPSGEVYDQAASDMERYRINQNSDCDTVHKFYAALSKILPEYSIFAVNPYDYVNPMDILVQRHNIENFVRKYNNYNQYIGIVNKRVEEDVREIMDICGQKELAIWDEMDDKIGKLDPEDPGYMLKIHAIHKAYYPKANGVKQVYWNQATSITVTAYQQKIRKYAEQMYNDCMKHIVLISDDNIRAILEERLQASLLSGLEAIFNQVWLSFSFTIHDEECWCDLEALEAKREELEKERNRLANEQIQRNMEAKKRFESGELDENSAYYKKCIKPYEVTINTPFVQGVVGPYKTTFKLKLDFLDFEQVEHHIRNTTTYNGGIEIGSSGEAGPAEIGAKAYLRFSAIKGANGQFAMEDVDIVGGGKVTLGTGFTSAEAGMEASAVRGTRSYANFSVTADSLLDEELKSAMGEWAPNLSKEIWSGDYPHY